MLLAAFQPLDAGAEPVNWLSYTTRTLLQVQPRGRDLYAARLTVEETLSSELICKTELNHSAQFSKDLMAKIVAKNTLQICPMCVTLTTTATINNQGDR